MRQLQRIATCLLLFWLGMNPSAMAGKLQEELITRPFTGDLPEMKKRRLIRALVVYGPTDFFFREGKLRGIQVDLLKEYEKFLNKGKRKETDRVVIAFVPVPFEQLIPSLKQGKGDLIAHFLTPTVERKKELRFASGEEQDVNELVVVHKDQQPVKRLEDLAGREVYVLRGSSYLEHLEALNEKFIDQGLQPIHIEPADERLRSEDILELVNAGVVGITVVDDYKARLWAQVLPDIRVLEEVAVTEGNNIGWAVRRNNPELAKSLKQFARKVKKGTLLGNLLIKRYYNTTDWIDNPAREKDRKRFLELIGLFRKYGEQYGFDYLALVAQAYQESGLNQKRRSHRGAVGVMQILPSTARSKYVGIEDISKVENNIHVGTKYLAFIRDRYFSDPEIKEDERMAFTWAAYNAGPAKVQKMCNKAEKMGLDPNRWFGHTEIAAGRLVGRETVRYVSNIHKYYVAYRLVTDLYSEDKLFKAAGVQR